MTSRESQRLGKYEREKKTKFETFNDGVCRIYKLEDTAGALGRHGQNTL